MKERLNNLYGKITNDWTKQEILDDLDRIIKDAETMKVKGDLDYGAIAFTVVMVMILISVAYRILEGALG